MAVATVHRDSVASSKYEHAKENISEALPEKSSDFHFTPAGYAMRAAPHLLGKQRVCKQLLSVARLIGLFLKQHWLKRQVDSLFYQACTG